MRSRTAAKRELFSEIGLRPLPSSSPVASTLFCVRALMEFAAAADATLHCASNLSPEMLPTLSHLVLQESCTVCSRRH